MWCCIKVKVKEGLCLSEQPYDVDVNNPPQGSRACSLPAYRTLTPLNAPRPAWQLCCHRVVTCQILMYMQCVLCFSVSCMIPPTTITSSSHVHSCAWCTSGLTPISTPLTPPHPPPRVHPWPHLHWHCCMCCCMACGAAPLPGASPGTGLPHPRTTRALWAQRSSRPAWSAWASISPTMHRYLVAASPCCQKFNWFLFLFFFYPPYLLTLTADPSSPNLWVLPHLATSSPVDCCGFSSLIPPFDSSFSPSNLFLRCPCYSPSPWSHRWPCRRDQESWMRKTSKPALSPWVTTW